MENALASAVAEIAAQAPTPLLLPPEAAVPAATGTVLDAPLTPVSALRTSGKRQRGAGGHVSFSIPSTPLGGRLATPLEEPARHRPAPLLALPPQHPRKPRAPSSLAGYVQRVPGYTQPAPESDDDADPPSVYSLDVDGRLVPALLPEGEVHPATSGRTSANSSNRSSLIASIPQRNRSFPNPFSRQQTPSVTLPGVEDDWWDNIQTRERKVSSTVAALVLDNHSTVRDATAHVRS